MPAPYPKEFREGLLKVWLTVGFMLSAATPESSRPSALPQPQPSSRQSLHSRRSRPAVLPQPDYGANQGSLFT